MPSSAVSAASSSKSEGSIPQASQGKSTQDSSMPAVQPLSSSQPSSSQPLTAVITIPEGYTLARIGMMLEDKKICTAADFIAASQNGDFSEFSLIAAQQQNPNRCFKLEGYLYPDTYEIYTSETPDAIIRRMLANTEKKLDADIRDKIQSSGYTIDEIITLASIIEKEAYGHSEMPNISSVLNNRLNISMKLQCDVTINYVEGAIKPFITGDTNRYNSYYNTYKCSALPAGAICNPSLDAIKAALSPADTKYFYFAADANKKYYYAETWDEHIDNLQKAGIKTPA